MSSITKHPKDEHVLRPRGTTPREVTPLPPSVSLKFPLLPPTHGQPVPSPHKIGKARNDPSTTNKRVFVQFSSEREARAACRSEDGKIHADQKSSRRSAMDRPVEIDHGVQSSMQLKKQPNQFEDNMDMFPRSGKTSLIDQEGGTANSGNQMPILQEVAEQNGGIVSITCLQLIILSLRQRKEPFQLCNPKGQQYYLQKTDSRSGTSFRSGYELNGREKKLRKNVKKEKVTKSEEIENYVGYKDIDELVDFIKDDKIAHNPRRNNRHISKDFQVVPKTAEKKSKKLNSGMDKNVKDVVPADLLPEILPTQNTRNTSNDHTLTSPLNNDVHVDSEPWMKVGRKKEKKKKGLTAKNTEESGETSKDIKSVKLNMYKELRKTDNNRRLVEQTQKIGDNIDMMEEDLPTQSTQSGSTVPSVNSTLPTTDSEHFEALLRKIKELEHDDLGNNARRNSNNDENGNPGAKLNPTEKKLKREVKEDDKVVGTNLTEFDLAQLRLSDSCKAEPEFTTVDRKRRKKSKLVPSKPLKREERQSVTPPPLNKLFSNIKVDSPSAFRALPSCHYARQNQTSEAQVDGQSVFKAQDYSNKESLKSLPTSSQRVWGQKPTESYANIAASPNPSVTSLRSHTTKKESAETSKDVKSDKSKGQYKDSSLRNKELEKETVSFSNDQPTAKKDQGNENFTPEQLNMTRVHILLDTLRDALDDLSKLCKLNVQQDSDITIYCEKLEKLYKDKRNSKIWDCVKRIRHIRNKINHKPYFRLSHQEQCNWFEIGLEISHILEDYNKPSKSYIEKVKRTQRLK